MSKDEIKKYRIKEEKEKVKINLQEKGRTLVKVKVNIYDKQKSITLQGVYEWYVQNM